MTTTTHGAELGLRYHDGLDKVFVGDSTRLFITDGQHRLAAIKGIGSGKPPAKRKTAKRK